MMPQNDRLRSAQEALDRAHSASVHGTPEALSGSIGDRAHYVRAILAVAQGATQAWANWEAINTLLERGRPTREAMAWMSFGAFGTIRMALARDAILGAFRLSDPPQGDRLTLCQVATWLNDTDTVERLGSSQWAIDQGHRQWVADAAAARNAERIITFRQMVVPKWSTDVPTNNQLMRLRERLRPTRNHLAHAISSELNDVPSIDDMRQFLDLTLDRATDAALIWVGSAASADHIRETAREAAEKFWRSAFADSVAVYAQHPDSQKHDDFAK